jgi:GGDEF domain-containing protein
VFNVDCLQDLIELAEKLRIIISRSSYRFETGKLLQVTVSIGGTMDQSKEKFEDIVRRADTNMHHPKKKEEIDP